MLPLGERGFETGFYLFEGRLGYNCRYREHFQLLLVAFPNSVLDG